MQLASIVSGIVAKKGNTGSKGQSRAKGQRAAGALALQRAKVRALQVAVRNERNLMKKSQLVVRLHTELLKLQMMVWKAKGKKDKALHVLKPARSERQRVVENYVDYLLWSKGLAPRRHTFPPFNVKPSELKEGITPAIRQAQLERALIMMCERHKKTGRISPKLIQAVQLLRPIPIPAKDLPKVDAGIAAIAAEVAVPTSSTDQAVVADSTIPADPEKLTDAAVDELVVDSEATEKGLESGDIAAEDAVEVETIAAQPAETAVAAGSAEAAKVTMEEPFTIAGIDAKTLAIGAAIAAGVYFLVLKK